MNRNSETSLNTTDTARLCSMLSTRILGRELWVFSRLDSTSSLLRRLQPDETPEGLVCIAEEQYEGKGQHKKKWYSEKGQGVSMSVILCPGQSDSLQLLMQSAALSVLRVLKNEYSVNSVLKWPNDILVGGRKVGGVLAEGTFMGTELERFILGIGINTNGQISSIISDIAINLESILGQHVDHSILAAHLINEIERQYDRWNSQDPNLITEINSHHRGYGLKNRIELGGKPVDGVFKFLGLDQQGYPVFLNEDDEVKRITRADIRFEPVE